MLAQTRRVPVIMYHDVVPERGPDGVWFDTTVAEFTFQMQEIARRGLTPISLDQLYAHLTEGKEIPEKSIVLTFDDNYQGWYDNAYPLLRQYGYPAVVFVHTGFVGDTSGTHPKMSWATLKELVKDPLITIGGHTITHPEDMTLLTERQQRRELEESKEQLEKELGKPIHYLAYPVGKNDETTRKVTKELGYKMAFTIDNMLAEESPNILQIGRYIQTRFDTALGDQERSELGAPAAVAMIDFAEAPVTYEEHQIGRVDLALVRGGRPVSVNSATRKGVLDFVREQKAVAGINGGFFDMASVQGTGNRMIGPFKSSDLPIMLKDQFPERWPKLRNRPLVFWGPQRFAIVPFQPEQMNSQDAIAALMPDVTDVFLAGVWLVHGGEAQTEVEQNTFGSKDIQDYRKRAFIGVDDQGRFVAGATRSVNASWRVARAIAELGIREAVLLDSGFSTSLVYGEEIKAFGHSTKTRPSRPVPHAIVIQGQLDPAGTALPVEVEADVGG
jgi:peptidoglycan/xylan/chitin deacetylase (PgdA/CDA1 family)